MIMQTAHINTTQTAEKGQVARPQPYVVSRPRLEQPQPEDHLAPHHIEMIRQTLPAEASAADLQRLLHMAQTYGLDPLQQEIWLIYRPNPRTGRPEANVITTRDGYLKYAQQNPEFEGLISFEVCEGDVFQIDAQTYSVKHNFGAERGTVLGAWARCDRAGKRPFISYAPYHEYAQPGSATWDKYPSAMIKKVAEVMVLKRAFGISGLVTREEIGIEEGQQRQRQALPLQTLRAACQQIQRITQLDRLLDFERRQPKDIREHSDFYGLFRQRKRLLERAIIPLTAAQREHLLTLLQEHHITADERFRMEAALDHLTCERAAKAIHNLEETILTRKQQEMDALMVLEQLHKTPDPTQRQSLLQSLPGPLRQHAILQEYLIRPIN
jgi:phage recombination protein Bet